MVKRFRYFKRSSSRNLQSNFPMDSDRKYRQNGYMDSDRDSKPFREGPKPQGPPPPLM